MVEWVFVLYFLGTDGQTIGSDTYRFPTEAECVQAQQEVGAVCGGRVTPCKPVQMEDVEGAKRHGLDLRDPQ